MKSHFSLIWESVADAVPEHVALIQGARRISWRDYEDRAARLAQGLLDAGLGHDSKGGHVSIQLAGIRRDQFRGNEDRRRAD
ncbi:MAG TPA: hypothetical protein DDW59_04175 [Gammaproteobacteria bacterium]|nr:hypothetical protein [Gammaproteobacteria bacterium]